LKNKIIGLLLQIKGISSFVLDLITNNILNWFFTVMVKFYKRAMSIQPYFWKNIERIWKIILVLNETLIMMNCKLMHGIQYKDIHARHIVFAEGFGLHANFILINCL
jgi:hypothetical protein